MGELHVSLLRELACRHFDWLSATIQRGFGHAQSFNEFCWNKLNLIDIQSSKLGFNDEYEDGDDGGKDNYSNKCLDVNDAL